MGTEVVKPEVQFSGPKSIKSKPEVLILVNGKLVLRAKNIGRSDKVRCENIGPKSIGRTGQFGSKC